MFTLSQLSVAWSTPLPLAQWAGHPPYAISLGVVRSEHTCCSPQGTELFIWGENIAEAIFTIQLVKMFFFQRLSYSLPNCHKYFHYALLHVAALKLLSVCFSSFLNSWFARNALETPVCYNAKHWFRSVEGWGKQCLHSKTHRHVFYL